MKKITIILFIIIQLQTYSANADELKELFKFGGGILTSYLTHEAAHEISARITGNDINMHLNINNDICNPVKYRLEYHIDNSEGFIINASGLITHPLTNEIILKSKKINRNDSFVKGIFIWNVINPIIYSMDYWFINRVNKTNHYGYSGDIAGIETYSSKTTANLFAGAITCIALSQAYRFYFYKDDEEISLNFLPTNGGVLFSINFNF